MRKNGKGKEENEGKMGKNEKVMKESENCKWKKDWTNLRTFFFFLLFTFRKPLKLFWVYQNGYSYRVKARITLGKIGKSDFAPPPEKFPCYAPVRWCAFGYLVVCNFVVLYIREQGSNYYGLSSHFSKLLYAS